MIYCTFYFVVPAPTVNTVVIGNETVGSSITLKCNATVVKGINSSVDIIWIKDDTEVLRENDTVGYPVNGRKLLLYTSYYNITLLQMSDNDTVYNCQAVINTNPLKKNSMNYTLNVIGEYFICNYNSTKLAR